MFQELDWLSVRSRINYNKAVVIYKALNNMTPDYITKLIIPMSQTHSLNLRSGQNGTLYTPLARTSLYSGAFTCSAPKLWNSFPQEVRNSTSLSAFKRNVRTICLVQQEIVILKLLTKFYNICTIGHSPTRISSPIYCRHTVSACVHDGCYNNFYSLEYHTIILEHGTSTF